MTKRILAMALVLVMVLSMVPVAAGAETVAASPKAGTHTVAGHSAECADHCAENVTWTAWDGDRAKLAAGGHYYLTENVTLTAEVEVAADLHLCLNGYVLTAAKDKRIMGTKGNTDVTVIISDCTAYKENDTLYAGALTGGNDTSSTGGGALFARREGAFYLNNIRILNNATVTAGGALLLQASSGSYAGGKMFITGCEISNNRSVSGTTAKNGGAINAGGGTVLEVTDSVFANNSGSNGGAINGSGTVKLTNSVFTGNSGVKGGVVYGAGSSALEISGCTFTENTATTAGAVAYMGGKTAKLENITVTGNTCNHATAGGAMYLGSASCKLTLSGKIHINGNTVNSAMADLVLYYADSDTIYVNGLAEESSVKFCAHATENPAAKDLVVVDGKQDTWDPSWLIYKNAQGKLRYVDKDETGFIFLDKLPVPVVHTHCVCGEISCTTHEQVTYQAWDGDVAKLAAGGKYYLTKDVQLPSEAVVAADLDLCLNGHTLTAAANSRHLSTASGSKATITISDCTAKTENGTYTAGKLTGGNSTKDGGAIYLYSGTKLYLYDGILSGNTTAVAGGAIMATGGAEAYLYGGLITGNTATGNSGAIHTGAATVLTLDGVTIQNNTTKRYGGAVYVNSTAVLTLSGNTVITGNKRNSSTNNLHMAGTSLLTVKDLGDKAEIGISGAVRAISHETTDVSGNFFSDSADYDVIYQDGKLHLAVPFSHVHCECGKADCADTAHKKITYEAWTDAESLPASGNYCLTKDVTISKEVTLKEDLHLCLNGHKVTGTTAKVRFYSTSGSNNEVLTITDCTAKTENGAYKAGGFYNNQNTNTSAAGGAFFIRAGGTLKFYEGIVSGCSSVAGGAAFYGSNATVYFYNGQVTGNKAVTGSTWKNGGAFYLSNSSLTIFDGQFTGNEASNGGAIYTTGTCTLDIRGGTITGNISHSNSGAINVGATCQMKLSGSPVITGNTLATGNASNVYLSGVGMMDVADLGKDAKIGVNASAFRVISTETQDYAANFLSDNTKVKIVYKDKVLYTDAEGNHKHCLCGGSSNVGCDHATTTYVEWDDPTSMPTAGNYYLSVDVTVAAQSRVEKGTLNLCLNGHTVQVSQKGGRVFYLAEGGTLNISDCAGGGTLTGATSSAILTDSAGSNMTINLYGGTFTGNRNATSGGAIVAQGVCTLNMYGGKLVGNTVESSLILDTNGQPVLDASGNQTCNAANGGALYLGPDAVFNLYGGQISDNTATEVNYVKSDGSTSYTGGSGGALYIRGVANLYGGKISGNTAKLGGGAIVSGTGAELNILGAEISGNKAASGGGLISQTASVINLKSGSVSANTSTGNGGGIYVSTGTILNMTGGSITANIASGNGSLKNGAGIYLLAGTANISGGTISDHKAANGAAIYMCLSGTRYPTLTISGDVLITNNKASAAGGAISVTGEGATITMSGGTISKNTAKNGGGVITQTKSAFTLSGGKITGNSCTSAGGGVYISTNTTFTMSGGSIDSNHSAGDGGGISLLRSTATFKGGSVSNNTAINHAGIRVSGATVTIHNLTLTGNRATGKLNAQGEYTGGNAGGLFAGQQTYTSGGAKLIATPKVTIYNIYAANNTANNAGGAMLIQSKDTQFAIHGGTFANNTAGGSGGALYLSTNIKATVSNASFHGNSAKAAAAVNFLGCQATLDSVKVYDNTAKSQGGAFVIGRETADVTMKNMQIHDNVCEGAAGAILLQNYAKLRVEDSKFTGNSCQTSGGAFYFGNPCYANFKNVEFTGNQSAGIGGAIHVHANADVTMDDVAVIDNVAEGDYGGGISSRGRLVLNNSKILNNKCLAGYGGGIGTGRANSIYLADENGVFATNVIISGNEANLQGGGIFGHRGGPVYLKGCTITDNTAAGEGGGICVDGRFSLIDSTVTGNTSGGLGYAVYMTAAEYDGHSYSTGFKKVGGDVIVRDNENGDMYISEGTGVAVVGEAIGEKAHLEITLHSGVLSEHLFGVYHYEGGNLKYTVTAGDRSVTDPEEYVAYQAPGADADGQQTQGIGDIWLYVGAGALVLILAAVAIVLVKKKKSPAGETK